ncbi:MAG: MBG domain-containing protein [Bacillota bacterium]|nr:MBG domain-containing protein [Bacillota bacterium]
MTKQKTISIFLILALTVTAIFGFGVFSSKSAAKAVIEEDFEEQYISSSVFEIDSIEDWDRISKYFNRFNFWGKTIKLNCDIDMRFYPSGFNVFRGTFEGNNHSIFNLTDTLFQEIASIGVVRNLNIYNVDITNSHAVLAHLNQGLIENVSAHGKLIYNQASGLVYNNNGIISNCFSFLDIIDPSQNYKSYIGGLAGINVNQIIDSHFIGSITTTNNSQTGGLTAINYGSIERCSARFDLNIDVVKPTSDLTAGGITAVNGSYREKQIIEQGGELIEIPEQLVQAQIYNSHAIINVEYISSSTEGMAVGGLVGLSGCTIMENSYSDIKGQGVLYGIIASSQAKPIYDEAENIVDYEFLGTKDIENCFSIADLQPQIIRDTHGGELEEILPSSNNLISYDTLFNDDTQKLAELLQNPQAEWKGSFRQHPYIQDSFFIGEGTAENPFIIDQKNHIFMLRGFMYDDYLDYYLEQRADLDFYNIEFKPLNFYQFFSTYDANDFLILNLDAPYFINENSGTIKNLGFMGGTLQDIVQTQTDNGLITNCYTPDKRYGDTYNNPSIYMGEDFVLSQTFGLTTGQSFVTLSRDHEFTEGNGSMQNPYVICTANQLAAIGSLDSWEYAILGNDIQINNSKWAGKYQLDIAGFSGNLDGKGHSIVGLLDEPLIRSTFTGKIKNLKLRGINTAFDNIGLLAGIASQTAVAENIEIYGSLSRNGNGGLAGENQGHLSYIRNYAVISAVDGGGIVGENQGFIEKSMNYGYAYYAIAQNTSTGIIKDCLNRGQSQALYGGGEIYSSINYQDQIELWHENEKIFESPTIPYEKLSEFEEYDLTVWGYAIKDNANPVIKYKDKFYKKDISNRLFNKSLNFDRTYNPNKTTLISMVEYDLILDDIFRENMIYTWYHNGELFEESQIIDAGEYKVRAFFNGDDYTHSAQYELVIRISRAPLPQPDFWGSKGIEGVHRPYIYDGEPYDLSQIQAFNLVSILNEEHYSYTVTKDGLPVEDIISVGIYQVQLTIDNPNYTVFQTVAQVTVIKAQVVIQMQSYTIDYLDALPSFQFEIDLQTREGLSPEEIDIAYDNARTAIEAEGQAVCAYQQGDDIGEYEISFEAELENYEISVMAGTLTVLPIPLSDENIVFLDAEKVYSGYIIGLEAQISDPAIEVEYLNNNNKDVGEYTITAIFSKANYLPLEKQAILNIIKAPLEIRPEDKEIEYNTDPPVFNLDIASIDFLGDDDISLISGEAIFSTNYTKGNSVGTYYITVAGLSSQNYQISYEQAVLTVVPSDMYELFVFNSAAFIYDGIPKSITLEVFSHNPIISYTYKLNGEVLEGLPIDSGHYQVEAHVQAISENYRDTVFAATLSIIKADIDAYFLPEYSFEYDKEAHFLEYQGTLQDIEEWANIQQYAELNGQILYEFRDAGEYLVTMVFEGHRNYNDKEISTRLIIEKKQIEIEIIGTKFYSAKPQIPDFIFSQEPYSGDEIEIEWRFSFLGYGYEDSVAEVVDAGLYTCYPKSLNPNYQITNTPIFEIQRLNVLFVPIYVEFEYGEYKDFNYIHQGMPIDYISGPDFIIRKNYYVEHTEKWVDIKYFFSGPNAGIYDVEGVENTPNYVFIMPKDAEIGKIRIKPRKLTYEWNDTYFVKDYNGQEQQPFEIELGNILTGDTVTARIMANGNLKDAGTYTLWAELVDSPNYSLDASTVLLEILRVPLTIKADDKSVVRGTLLVNFTATIDGLVAGETLASLGISLVFNCAYSISSPAGINLPITISRFELNNYDIEFIDGTLTVTANEYPLMTMRDKTFEYDGEIKALRIEEPYPEGWQDSWVTFINNFQTQAGVYDVTAIINYPNATQQRLTAKLTILKATPILEFEVVQIPYSVIAFLTNDDIIGVARIGDKTVSGTFSWIGNTQLKRGQNDYQALFVPDDINNINQTVGNVRVISRTLSEDVFVFDSVDIVIADNDLYITQETTLTLSDEYDNLELYHNGLLTKSVRLSDSGEYHIVIKRKGSIVYDKTFNVIIRSPEDPDDVLPRGEDFFNITGGYFDDEGRIFVEGDCFITLVEGYPEAKLYLDGKEFDFIVLDGNEKTVKLQITYQGSLVYSRTFAVVLVQEDPPPPQEEKPVDKWLLISIIGGITVGAGLCVLIYFGVRRFINRRKREYNPYDAVEKKKK